LDPFSSPGLRDAFLFMLPSYLIITPLLHLHITDAWAGEQGTSVALLGTIRGYVNHFRVTTTSSLINVSSRQTAVKGEASPEKTHLSNGAVPLGRGIIAISCQICGKVPTVRVAWSSQLWKLFGGLLNAPSDPSTVVQNRRKAQI
jgi:hypothetical protein